MGIVFLIIALLVLMEFRACQENIGRSSNGYGSIVGVLTKSARAPTRHRVLVPWLVGVVNRLTASSANSMYVVGGRSSQRISTAAYMLLKYGLLAASVLVAWPLLGTAGIIVFALLMMTTFEFDYWCVYAEVIGTCLCLTGDPLLVLVGVVIWGLSKETVPLAVPLAWVSGGWVAGLVSFAGILTMLLVRRYQGKAELYTGRWTMRQMRIDAWRKRKPRPRLYLLGLVAYAVVGPYNPSDLWLSVARKDVGPWLSTLWTVGACFLLVSDRNFFLAQTAWVGLLWVLAAWIIARARETRIMLPVALWMASAIAG